MFTQANINCFLTLARTLNFTKTAQALSITQQSVSQHIAKMEEGLGFPLFIRSRHSVILTQSGREYYQFFTEFSDQYQQLYTRCKSRTGGIRLPIKIGFQDWTSLGSAASIAIKDLAQLEPEVDVSFTHRQPGLLVQGLKKKELQLIVLFERWAPKTPGFHVAPLMETEVVILVSPDNPLATPDTNYKAFANEPFIIDNYGLESASATNRRMQQELKMIGFAPSRLIVMPDREAAYTACELGRGCVLSTGLNRVMQSGHLVAYPTGISENLVCVWPSNGVDPAVDKLAELMQNAFHPQSIR